MRADVLGLAKKEDVDIGVERMENVVDGNVGEAVDRKEVDGFGSEVGDKVGGVMEVVVGNFVTAGDVDRVGNFGTAGDVDKVGNFGTAGGVDKVGIGDVVGMQVGDSMVEEACVAGVEKRWSAHVGVCWWEW